MVNFTTKQFTILQAKRGESLKAASGVDRESELQNQIAAECRLRGWNAFHGNMRQRTARTIGEPDFIIAADKGRVFFVECKTRTGKLSPEQAAIGFQLQKNGHKFCVVRSFEEFLEVIL